MTVETRRIPRTCSDCIHSVVLRTLTHCVLIKRRLGCSWGERTVVEPDRVGETIPGVVTGCLKFEEKS